MSVEAIAVALIGYLLGSIPVGVLVAKRYGVDIYRVGSENPGATNVLRSIGKTAGYLVFFLDFLKGFVATVWFTLPIFSFSGDASLGLWGLPAAVLGHTFPLFAKFKGGKGVATAMGGLLGVMPDCLIFGLVCWVIIFFATRYVALASIGFGVSLPICSLIRLWTSEAEEGQLGRLLLGFLVMGWIVWRHRENLRRLKAGTENRFEKKKNP